MSQIVASTDFSQAAQNAVYYACDMASALEKPLIVLHSFLIPVSFGETPLPLMSVEEGVEIAEMSMNRLISSLQLAYPHLDLSSKIIYGDIVECLEDYAEENKPMLIIVGNSGAGEAESWLGSNVTSILKHRKSTILAIPPDLKYKRPEKICFASDFKQIDEEFQAAPLIDLVMEMSAQLHVLNIDSDKNAEPSLSFESTELHNSLLSIKPVYHHVESKEVNEAIVEFVEANEMDWLVIFPHKHSFLEALFHKSHTKAMARKISVPLVSIPGK